MGSRIVSQQCPEWSDHVTEAKGPSEGRRRRGSDLTRRGSGQPSDPITPCHGICAYTSMPQYAYIYIYIASPSMYPSLQYMQCLVDVVRNLALCGSVGFSLWNR